MRQGLSYAAAGLGLVLVAALAAVVLAGGGAARAVGLAALLAYGLQLVAFGVLLAVRADPQLFLAGWGGGILLRFGAVGAVAYWLSRDPELPRAVTLLSLVAFMMLLLLLEPVFLHGRRSGGTAQGAAAAGVDEGAN
ncbi:MAG: hypothetical protein FIB01_10570 [Gemmatimonadetes bacterium]|nr:hypothetical protein [Gemmatimonadota bacterium]